MVQAWREITAEWQGESTFIGKNTNGGSVQMGKIGNKPGISPMELIQLPKSWTIDRPCSSSTLTNAFALMSGCTIVNAFWELL